MTQPQVIITELDGSLGVLPPSAGRLLAVVGVSSAGPINVPAAYARVRDLVAAFGGGPTVEAAAYHINLTGRPVVFVRADDAVDGEASAVTSVALGGTSVVTLSPLPAPSDDFDIMLTVVAPGTVGTAGVTYRLSYDGGRTNGPATALGTDTTLEVPDAGIEFAFAAGTLVAGATFSVRTTAPNFDAATLKTALDALNASLIQWELCEVVGALETVGAFDAVELAMEGMFAKGKYRGWVGHARVSDVGETEAAYLTALSGIFGDSVSKFGSFYAGACKLTSAISGRKYRRPFSFATASREQSSSEEVNIADVNLGPLAGVSIRDANGNADEHDESLNPGLDDARFAVARTWDGLQGVYVNRPRLFSAEGSDFQIMPHRRVLNLAHAALRQYFIRRLNKPIRIDKTTGFILESEALEIESGANSALATVLLAKPKASAANFVLSRTDNVLSNKTLTGNARVTPLGYPEYIELETGWFNPALVVQAA